MKASAFKYLRPNTMDEIFAAFAEHGDDAMILAGGQSLLPTLNMRLAQPAILVDINRIPELSGIERQGDIVRIGATTRHVEVLRSDIIASDLPLIGCAIQHVAHRGVRNRGTFGGSLSHADPAAEMAACAVASDATSILISSTGERRVPASDFFQGVMTTDRKWGEVLSSVEFPAFGSDEVWAFRELCRRQGDFAQVGVAAKARLSGSRLEELRLVVFGCEECPKVSEIAVEMGSSGHSNAEIAAAVANELDPMTDLSGTADTKRIQARTLVERTLSDLIKGQAKGVRDE